MVVEVKKIVKFCEDYLKVKDWQDHCVNGLQVEGAPKVSKIITGVSLSQQLIGVAIKKRAKMIIVHHGLFDRYIPHPIQIKGVVKNRLKMLLENNINLLGFHLPLDAHEVIGNNISLLKLLGLKKVSSINSPKFGEIGFIGELSKVVKLDDFIESVNDKLKTKSYVITGGPRKIQRIGIISGGPVSDYDIARELGVDVFLTGAVEESDVRQVEEIGINYIAAGHYNTEKLGIQNLGELIAKKFGVKVEFVDIPCDV